MLGMALLMTVALNLNAEEHASSLPNPPPAPGTTLPGRHPAMGQRMEGAGRPEMKERMEKKEQMMQKHEEMKEKKMERQLEHKEKALEKINEQLGRINEMEKRLGERKVRLMEMRRKIESMPAGTPVDMEEFHRGMGREDRGGGMRPMNVNRAGTATTPEKTPTAK